ncbi:lysM and putative peptidoglycan-binding domain-containing protein 4 [Anopheles maculipalpis]|uniref:lysM and putative peptidoglycan-binding domain-containing protein 4 n=1 Tax=Anopheles maculipalpis TaxID=1496333 RepID=UPI0021599E32|nr:lysM and putative peptidoglycan-binding domain-containing protein 4 [Anopheles maculipalpis]
MKRMRVKAEPSSNHVYVEEPYTTDYSDFPPAQQKSPPIERWLEAQILPGDTLQAIALRFNCSIPQLKKLNKIDKDNEIYARNVIRVPVTPHSILLETLPRVHTSGNSSPKNITNTPPNVDHVPAGTSKATLDEKLILAAVSNASIQPSSSAATQFPKKSSGKQHRDLSARSNEIELEELHGEADGLASQPLLLSGEYDDSIPQPRSLRLPANDFSCNGSDCDISWICLLVFILALCFAIPLIYVVYVAEHIDKYHHDSFNHINNHSSKL